MSRTWSPQDREEYEVACAEAWDHAEGTRERALHFLALVQDAAQAHRPWALSLLDEFLESGSASELKRWRKRTQRVVAVAHDGRVLDRPRVVGVVRQRDDGARYSDQTLYDLLTWEQIEEVHAGYLRQISAYRDNAYITSLLLELRNLAPAAMTPREAAELLGTTVDAWLDERTAA
jgi:hypothetical protein